MKSLEENLWTIKDRNIYWDQAQKQHFDLIIVGGGVTGAGIAREAALRGLTFLLLDKQDFAYGTSSRSSKLAHGGLRYLASGDFGLARESTTERNWLRVHLPHLVRPVAFNLYSYEGYMYKPKKVKLAMFLYDLLSNAFSKYKNYKRYQILSREEFLRLEPNIRPEGLVMGGYYYDMNIDDARLTLESIKEALFLSSGNSVALNYAKVEEFVLDNSGRAIGVKVEDKLTSRHFTCSGKQIVNATGIWADEILRTEQKLIRPTKGVHIIIRNNRVGNNQSFGLQSKIDGRFYFVLRREKFTVIGTTDTDYQGDLENPICTKEDCDYLFHTVNWLFPNAQITYKDIISTYAGIRPLVQEEGKSESQVSRKHVILDHPNGIVSLLGGKLTIYRLMGEQLLFHLINKGVFPKDRFSKTQLRKEYSKQPFLIGLTRKDFDQIYRAGVNSGEFPSLDEDLLECLHRQYGKSAFSIMKSIKAKPELGQRFLPENELIPAEVEWICDHEFAPHLIDVLCRRTEAWIFVQHIKSQELASKVAAIMARKYGWSTDQTQKEIQTYVEYQNAWVWF